MRKSRNIEYRVMRSDNGVSNHSNHRKLRSSSIDHPIQRFEVGAYSLSNSNIQPHTKQLSQQLIHGNNQQHNIKTSQLSTTTYHQEIRTQNGERRGPDIQKLKSDQLINQQTNHKEWLNDDLKIGEKKDKLRQYVDAPTLRNNPDNIINKATVKDELDILEDLDITEISTSYVPSKAVNKRSTIKGRRLSNDEMKQIKQLMFGTTTRAYPNSWKKQGFVFDNKNDLRFGLVQDTGGPCGVLAVIQAFLIKVLVHGCQLTNIKKANDPLHPTEEESNSALLASILHIIQKCCDNQRGPYTICLTDLKTGFDCNPLLCDGFTEYVTVHQCSTFTNLREFLTSNLDFYLNGSGGAGGSMLAVVYSIILTRGIEKVREDCDSPDVCLLSQLFYCNQELVNLVLTGRASSNGFNKNKELPGGFILKGIHSENEIGLLSLFEFYKSCEIGSYLKSPLSNIWVICSESHFSLLFSLQQNTNEDENFDLYYYDGLSRQDSLIRLTLEPETEVTFLQPITSNSPLENCIRTKWKDVAINWNGSERLL